MGDVVAVNERGKRIGQDHPAARLTDQEVELMRQLHEEHSMGLTALARMFDVTKKAVWQIVTYRLRAQTVASFKARTVYLTPDPAPEN